MSSREVDLYEQGWLAGITSALHACAEVDTAADVQRQLLDLVVEAQHQQWARDKALAGRARYIPAPRHRRLPATGG